MLIGTRSSVLAILVVLAACGGKTTGQEPSTVEIPSVPVQANFKGVPANAVFIVSIAAPESFWDLAINQNVFPIAQEQATALDSAMREHIQKHLGLDVSRVQSVLLFGSMGGGAAVIGPVQGSLKGAHDEDGLALLMLETDGKAPAAEKKLVAALHDDTLIVGTQESVLASAAVLDGKGAPLSGDFEQFAQEQIRSSHLSAAANLADLPMPPNPFTHGLVRGALKVDSSGIHLTVTGEPETLRILKTELESRLAMAIGTLKREMESSRSEFAIGVGAILAYYNAQSLASSLDPVIDGDSLRLDSNLLGGGISGTMVVAGVGVLAAVAIPAFMKYMKKSKNAEAIQFIKIMSDAARFHYLTSSDPLAPTGERRFPASVGPTPPLGTCCAMEGKCMPSSETWQHPTWKALNFAVRDPHYYSYEFKTETTDGVTSYTALAYGDLDCDGVYSTFSHYGEIVDGEPISAGDIIKQDPLE